MVKTDYLERPTLEQVIDRLVDVKFALCYFAPFNNVCSIFFNNNIYI
jgi:hypothetical protein